MTQSTLDSSKKDTEVITINSVAVDIEGYSLFILWPMILTHDFN